MTTTHDNIDPVRLQLSGLSRVMTFSSADEALTCVTDLMTCPLHDGGHHFAVIGEGGSVAMSELAVGCVALRALRAAGWDVVEVPLATAGGES